MERVEEQSRIALPHTSPLPSPFYKVKLYP